MIRFPVIDQYLFTGFDIAQREEDYMLVNDPGITIRHARMIYVLRAITLFPAINSPVRVQTADVKPALPFQTASYLVPRNLLTRILGNLTPLFEMSYGETTIAIDFRWFDRNAWCEIRLHLRSI